MAKLKLLLVNPPIYDFTAYDFWIKPYGLLQAGGLLRSIGQLWLFDYLDRLHPAFDKAVSAKTDACGLGPYPEVKIPKPKPLDDIPRYYRRFGMPRGVFQDYLFRNGPFDAVLIQTMMTYWYPGVREVIDDVRTISPGAKIILGGFYAVCCPEHARGLGADAVVSSDDLTALWQTLGQTPPAETCLPAWELYPRLHTAVLKLTSGCTFHCSYCFVPVSRTPFKIRPLEDCLAQLRQLVSLGVRNIAFYDDALLYQPEKILLPFLRYIVERKIGVHFHTPNALHARFITAEVAEWMVRAGFRTFYLGFESRCELFHRRTGSCKVAGNELEQAVQHLLKAGAKGQSICAYEMLGHPQTDIQQLEDSMRFVHSLGIRIMLSDFSPIPGTPDGELCRTYTNLDEPLNHNKTAFPIRYLGIKKVNYYKDLCRRLNSYLH